MWESRWHRPHRPGELWLRTRLAPVFSSAGAFALRALVLGLGAGPGVRGCSVPPSVSVFAVRPRFLRHGRAASFVALCLHGSFPHGVLTPRCGREAQPLPAHGPKPCPPCGGVSRRGVRGWSGLGVARCPVSRAELHVAAFALAEPRQGPTPSSNFFLRDSTVESCTQWSSW